MIDEPHANSMTAKYALIPNAVRVLLNHMLQSAIAYHYIYAPLELNSRE